MPVFMTCRRWHNVLDVLFSKMEHKNIRNELWIVSNELNFWRDADIYDDLSLVISRYLLARWSVTCCHFENRVRCRHPRQRSNVWQKRKNRKKSWNNDAQNAHRFSMKRCRVFVKRVTWDISGTSLGLRDAQGKKCCIEIN